MRKPNTLTLVIALSLLFSTPLSLPAGEHIEIKNLPDKVVNAINSRLPGAELVSAEKEKDDGTIEYEVNVRHDGKKYEVEVTEDGRIKEIEHDDD